MHEIKHSETFEKQLRKLGDRGTEILLLKAIKTLGEDPLKGEPLGHELAGLRSLRCVRDHRVVYEIESNTVIIIAFGHGHDPYDEIKRYFRATKKRTI